MLRESQFNLLSCGEEGVSCRNVGQVLSGANQMNDPSITMSLLVSLALARVSMGYWTTPMHRRESQLASSSILLDN
jgi:hypothetical protein